MQIAERARNGLKCFELSILAFFQQGARHSLHVTVAITRNFSEGGSSGLDKNVCMQVCQYVPPTYYKLAIHFSELSKCFEHLSIYKVSC